MNVVDNASNIGKELQIHGDITKYFGNLGVKNTSDYKFAGGGETGLETVWDFTILPTETIDATGNMVTNAAGNRLITLQTSPMQLSLWLLQRLSSLRSRD